MRLCKARLLLNEDGDHLPWPKVNMHHVAALIVKPVIVQRCNSHCSWVEFVADSPQKPAFFVSHNWAEPFRDFMESIEIHSTENNVRDRDAYWICTFALNQFCVDVGTGLEHAPFIKGLKAAKYGAMLMLDKTATSLTRIWCVLELYTILLKWDSLLEWPEQSLKIVTPMGIIGTSRVSSGPFVEAVASADSRLCQATAPADRRQILNYIAGRDEKTGLLLRTDGQIQTPKKLDFSMNRRMDDGEFEYEAQLLSEHSEKFDELNETLKASVGALFTQGIFKQRLAAQSLTKPASPRRNNSIILENNKVITKVHLGKVLHLEDISQRGMTLAQLRTMMQHIKNLCPGWKTKDGLNVDWFSATIYDYAREYQKEHQDGELMHSYMEGIAAEAQVPEYFISVAYSCKLHVMMASIEWHAEARGLPESTVYWSWFCSLSTPEIRGWDWTSGNPTERVLPVIDGTVLIVDSALETMKRANPAWDLYRFLFGDMKDKLCDLCCPTGVLATTKPFSTKSYEFGSFGSHIARAMLDFDVTKVHARNEESLRRVLSQIAGLPSDQEMPLSCDAFDNFNNRVHQLACAPLLRDLACQGDVAALEDMVLYCNVSLSSPYLCGVLGEVPLMLAAAHGHLMIMEFLLRAKSDPDQTDSVGETAMHYAAMAGQSDAARLLLRWGAGLAKLSHFEETPASVARQNPASFLGVDTSQVLKFFENEENITSLMSAPVLPRLRRLPSNPNMTIRAPSKERTGSTTSDIMAGSARRMKQTIVSL